MDNPSPYLVHVVDRTKDRMVGCGSKVITSPPPPPPTRMGMDRGLGVHNLHPRLPGPKVCHALPVRSLKFLVAHGRLISFLLRLTCPSLPLDIGNSMHPLSYIGSQAVVSTTVLLPCTLHDYYMHWGVAGRSHPWVGHCCNWGRLGSKSIVDVVVTPHDSQKTSYDPNSFRLSKSTKRSETIIPWTWGRLKCVQERKSQFSFTVGRPNV